MATQAATPSRQAIARSQALDNSIMGTNSSSIVSKRSVEQLYYANETHLFRYFVNKFQRRAPLVNRGYWLRLRAIDVIVRQFVTKQTPKKKVVINLGCGSDVLPWQCHSRYGAAIDNVLFIDVDYPDLMQKKRAVVLETPQLRDLLGTDFVTSDADNDCILLRSDKYCQLACDLRELDIFRSTLESFLDLSECEVLFVAEVSITYMDTQSANALIQWASSIGQAEFCLLEHILPQGPNHPFAQNMLAHFEKLSTPLRSVRQYSTLEAQVARFTSRGWSSVDIWDLWQAWESDFFVSNSEKIALDDVEPFDEWEEFILFCRHYFIIHASASEIGSNMKHGTLSRKVEDNRAAEAWVKVESQPLSKPLKRRFGNATTVTSTMGERHLLHMMGLESNGRAATYDVFSLGGGKLPPTLPLKGPLPRVCFSFTDLGNAGTLLVGGRTSPTSPLSDCWLFERSLNWVSMPRLPVPLFRHSAIQLGDSSLVLICGGKTGPSALSEDYFIFNPGKGWQKCQVVGPRPEPSFGSTVCNSSDPASESGVFHGLLAGGLNKYGHFISDKHLWCIDTTGSEPTISFKRATKTGENDTLSIFGASPIEIGSTVAICGGVGADASLQGCNISIISVSNNTYQVNSVARSNFGSYPIPFMIGSSATKDDDSIIVVGGGATCFAMGTYWETGTYRIRLFENILSSEVSSEHLGESIIKFQESHKYTIINQNDEGAVESSSTA
ncbi:tRNA wybutosine-synthesizing protein 4 [Cladobotryum mycophilum]|uniref:tRNA wybutosine-synthesizing protein 4 n=1 Tax=Cladobotryum mycophilum TaxID=491253 RepID=A0ABR0S9Q1_9HYPO